MAPILEGMAYDGLQAHYVVLVEDIRVFVVSWVPHDVTTGQSMPVVPQ